MTGENAAENINDIVASSHLIRTAAALRSRPSDALRLVRIFSTVELVNALEQERHKGVPANRQSPIANRLAHSGPLLNSGPAADGLPEMQAFEKAFSKIGVRLHKLPKLHSKIVAIDTDLLCIGSYNWLSADRHRQYARHETSFVYRVPGCRWPKGGLDVAPPWEPKGPSTTLLCTEALLHGSYIHSAGHVAPPFRIIRLVTY